MENNQSTDIATREIVGKGKHTFHKLIIVIWHCRLAQKKAKNATTRRSKSKLSAHRLPSPDPFKVKETESFCSQPQEPLRKRKRTLNCVIPPFTRACGCLVFYVYLSFSFVPWAPPHFYQRPSFFVLSNRSTLIENGNEHTIEKKNNWHGYTALVSL